MIFGSFAGDVSLYALLEQFFPPLWLHCMLSTLLIILGAIAVALIRKSLRDGRMTERLDAPTCTQSGIHFDE